MGTAIGKLPKLVFTSTFVANALLIDHDSVGNYTSPLDHSVIVPSDICQLGCHGESCAYMWRT